MDQKQYIGEQIKKLRVGMGLSAEQLGSKLDPPRSSSTITSWERGRTQPDGDTLIDLCIIFGVDISEFFYKSPEYEYAIVNLEDGSCDEDGYVDVPIYGEIAAGTPIEMLEFEDEFPVPTKVKNQHPHSGLLRVKGDSYNRRLPNGCLALVDFDMKEPNEHDPFAVCVNGYSATVKRVKRLANGFELIPNSYDPTYIPTVFDYNKHDTEEITIIGQVVWATMPFDYEI